MSSTPADQPPEQREEAQLVPKEEATREAAALLQRAKSGVLCTLSRRIEGWPFGSVAPYALNRFGEPLILIASIAEHTRNIAADSRVSLLVHDDARGSDVQSVGRLTVMGRAAPVEEREMDDAAARYLERVPTATSYFETHDFRLYRITLEHLRFIGGFGKIFWLDPDGLRLDPARDPLAAGAPAVVAHMNEDHRDALLLFCRAFRGLEPAEVEMVGVDQWGVDVLARGPERRLRFSFEAPASPGTIRGVMVELVRRARRELGAP